MENISKTKSIIFYIIFGILFVGLAIFAFVPMKFGVKDYEGFFGALSTSSESGDSISVEYEITEDEHTNVSKAIKMIADRIEEKCGANAVNVYRVGDNKIRADIAKQIVEEDQTELVSFLNTMASGKLVLTNSKSPSATLESNPDLVVIDGWTEITKISTSSYKGSYGITLDFNKSGKNKFEGLVGHTVYMYVNGKPFPSENYNSVEVTSEQTSLTMWFNQQEFIGEYYNTFNAGLIPVNFKQDNVQFSYSYNDYKNDLSLSFGNKLSINSNFAYNFLWIATAGIIVIMLAVSAIRHKLAGLIAGLSIIFGDFIILFMMQAMPWVNLGVASIITFVMAQVIEFALVEALLNGVKREYKLGKSLQTSFEDAYKKLNTIMLDVCIISLIGGLCFALLGGMEFVSMGVIIALSAVVTGLVNMLLVRFMLACMHAFGQEKFYGIIKREED